MKTFEINGNLSTIENFSIFCKTIVDVYNIFEKCFDKVTMSKIDLLVDNATDNSGYTPIITPVLGKYLIIKLGINNFNDEERIAFQFSHELCHYIFYSLQGLNKEFADSVEESLCVAMSLSIIKIMFTDNTFNIYNDYVLSLDDFGYKDGSKIAKQVNYDLSELKSKIYDKSSILLVK